MGEGGGGGGVSEGVSGGVGGLGGGGGVGGGELLLEEGEGGEGGGALLLPLVPLLAQLRQLELHLGERGRGRTVDRCSLGRCCLLLCTAGRVRSEEEEEEEREEREESRPTRERVG